MRGGRPGTGLRIENQAGGDGCGWPRALDTLNSRPPGCLAGESPQHPGEPVSRRKVRPVPLGDGEGCSDGICFQGGLSRHFGPWGMERPTVSTPQGESQGHMGEAGKE